MKFKLTIDSNNEAMVNDGQPEWPVMEILRDVAKKLGEGHTQGVIRDGSNGGPVGNWKLTQR